MTTSDEPPNDLGDLLDSPDLAADLESDRFKLFLDLLPIGVAVSALQPSERIVYANGPFERLSGRTMQELAGASWDCLSGRPLASDVEHALGEAVTQKSEYLGAYVVPHYGAPMTINAWSNVIEDDDATPAFRLVALATMDGRDGSILDLLQEQIQEKDVQLRELQHRVKNNLQMITALIRMEAKGVSDRSLGEGYDRLAGRVDALALLYKSLGDDDVGGAVDLGIYLTEIATSVMRAHAPEGIHLDLRVDTWPVSINVAMPAGLVVNELLTNSLKHAFVGRDGGTITLHSTNLPSGCRVIVADDGVGLPPGVTWPKKGKLSALIVRSLQQNAKAHVEIQSSPGEGSKVTIVFSSEDAAPTG